METGSMGGLLRQSGMMGDRSGKRDEKSSSREIRKLGTREDSEAAKVVKFVKSPRSELICEDLRPIRGIFVKSKLGRLVVPGARALGVRSSLSTARRDHSPL
jgi:hypothetical protein